MAKAVTGSEANARTTAAQGLGKLGAGAETARDALLKGLRDADAALGMAAGEALLAFSKAGKGGR